MEYELVNTKNAIERRQELLLLIASYEAKGFGNCQNVQKLKQELAQINFDRYKEKYPAYLFFTDEQFDEIVKKNNLKIVNTEAYIGHIPEHCFDAILSEHIDEDDLIAASSYTLRIESNYNGAHFYSPNASKAEIDAIKKMNKTEILSYISQQHICESRGVIVNKKFTLDEVVDFYAGNGIEKVEFSITIKNSEGRYGLFIACPENMINKSKIRKPSFVEKFIIKKQEEPLDPIVFRYVKDGVLVITFWI